jgi:hypothetical protein
VEENCGDQRGDGPDESGGLGESGASGVRGVSAESADSSGCGENGERRERGARGGRGGSDGRAERGGCGGRSVRGGATSNKKRGLRWAPVEDVALVEAYAYVSFDSVTGANQRAVDFYDRIEVRFLSDARCPSKEVFERLPIGPERSRWYGRGAKAVRARITLLKREMVALYAYRRRIDTMQLTGNSVTEDNLYRVSVFLYNGNSIERDGVYNNINDEHADLGHVYRYEAAYKHCIAHPHLVKVLQAGPEGASSFTARESAVVTAVVGASSEFQREDAITSGLQAQVRGRPVGQKRSKRARDGEAEEEPNSLAVISSSIGDYPRTNSLRTKSMEESRRISSRAIMLQTQTAAFATLYNALNAVATEVERLLCETRTRVPNLTSITLCT